MEKDLHPVLRRQLEKAGFNTADIMDEKFRYLIQRVSITYEDADRSKYLIERSMQISSLEMRELYEAIKHEKTSLEVALNEILEKDKVIAEKLALIAHAGRLASLGEMATSIAHELNQPLSIIRTNMQTLDMFMLEDMSQEERKEIISSSLRQVERASIIIDRMRGFGRKQTGELTHINIAQAINSAISMFNEQFRLHNIHIVYHQHDDSIAILSEPQEIEQIIINLLTNAKFALEKKSEELDIQYDMEVKITVNYDEDSKQVVLQLEDNGIGMSEETLAHCMEPFYTTKDIHQGTGLGLSIIQGIIKKHQGSMQLSSKKNQGTCIVIKLSANLDDNR